MNNQKEIYEALSAGETLEHDDGTLAKFDSNNNLHDPKFGSLDYNFKFPDCWQIYKEPKWYENIPEGGVLCWIGDNDNSVSVGLVIDYDPESKYKFRTRLCGWKVAKPLTFPEVNALLSNVPEEI